MAFLKGELSKPLKASNLKIEKAPEGHWRVLSYGWYEIGLFNADRTLAVLPHHVYPSSSTARQFSNLRYALIREKVSTLYLPTPHRAGRIRVGGNISTGLEARIITSLEGPDWKLIESLYSEAAD